MVEIRFDAALYSADAVKRALYRFGDRFVADVKLLSGEFVCSIEFPANVSAEAIQRDTTSFKKEVLDQDLREKIRTETAAVRNLILAHAFSKTGLIADEQVSAN